MTAARLALAAALLAACGDDDGNLPFGETAVVVVVNPVANEGNTAAPPAFVGTAHEGVAIDAEPGGSATTDATGLAVLHDLSVGPADLLLDGAPALPLDILGEGDVYDLAVAWDGQQVAAYDGFPIRYGVGGQILVIGTTDDASTGLATDSAIVFFEDGIHVGNLLIEAEDVILYGEGLTGESVVVDGSVEVRGGNVRIRGVTITGDLVVFGNNFGMSFSVVEGATQLNGQAISFLRNVFCLGANVPSSNAALYDNWGLDAARPAPVEACTP